MSTPVVLPVQRAEPAAETAPTLLRPEAAEPKAPKVEKTEARPAEKPSTRLLIEDVGGVFVYTVLDRVSGQVIARIPRENVETLGQVDGYEAGAVVNTDA